VGHKSERWTAAQAMPRVSLFARLRSLYARIFGEENFLETADPKPERDRNIRLVGLALDSATHLNSRRFSLRHGPALDLDEYEIVTVLCETARILMLEDKVRTKLNDLRLQAPPGDAEPPTGR